ncbi:MAG: phosphoglycerate mutase family protein [Marinicella sp.]|nr:histidine phosphatase family protein [Xanthomonadales bacterium]
MKKILLLLLIQSLLTFTVEAGTIFLIRHAEKADDGSKNPVLTAKGTSRANNIARMLSNANISKVYATDYNRTQLTAKPMADLLGVPVLSYDPRKLEDFVKMLKQLEGNALVVGHSNTTPQVAALLSGQEVKTMGESDFDDIYQVTLQGELAVVTMLKSLSYAP